MPSDVVLPPRRLVASERPLVGRTRTAAPLSESTSSSSSRSRQCMRYDRAPRPLPSPASCLPPTSPSVRTAQHAHTTACHPSWQARLSSRTPKLQGIPLVDPAVMDELTSRSRGCAAAHPALGRACEVARVSLQEPIRVHLPAAVQRAARRVEERRRAGGAAEARPARRPEGSVGLRVLTRPGVAWGGVRPRSSPAALPRRPRRARSGWRDGPGVRNSNA